LRFIIQINGGTSYVTGVIRDAFKHRCHLRNGDNEPEVTRSRLAQRDDVNTLSIDLYFEQIDPIVVIQHLSRDISITVLQRSHCISQRMFRLTAEQENPVSQFI
jgi:hypothetical protein